MDDFPFYENLKDTTIQLLLALIVIGCILLDTTFGFIMGLVLIVIYYEIYKKIIIQKKEIDTYKNNIEKTQENNQNTIQVENTNTYNQNINNNSCELSYLSNEHLIAAQNNIFDTNNFKLEIKGINTGYNNEKVYGAQGLDNENINQPGFDKDNMYSLL